MIIQLQKNPTWSWPLHNVEAGYLLIHHSSYMQHHYPTFPHIICSKNLVQGSYPNKKKLFLEEFSSSIYSSMEKWSYLGSLEHGRTIWLWIYFSWRGFGSSCYDTLDYFDWIQKTKKPSDSLQLSILCYPNAIYIPLRGAAREIQD